MFRAFYSPKGNDKAELFEDAATLEELTSGAIVVIKFNDNGTRELIVDQPQKNPKEKFYADYAKRNLEFKYDGGTTPDFVTFLKKRDND